MKISPEWPPRHNPKKAVEGHVQGNRPRGCPKKCHTFVKDCEQRMLSGYQVMKIDHGQEDLAASHHVAAIDQRVVLQQCRWLTCRPRSIQQLLWTSFYSTCVLSIGILKWHTYNSCHVSDVNNTQCRNCQIHSWQLCLGSHSCSTPSVH